MRRTVEPPGAQRACRPGRSRARFGASALVALFAVFAIASTPETARASTRSPPGRPLWKIAKLGKSEFPRVWYVGEANDGQALVLWSSGANIAKLEATRLATTGKPESTRTLGEAGGDDAVAADMNASGDAVVAWAGREVTISNSGRRSSTCSVPGGLLDLHMAPDGTGLVSFQSALSDAYHTPVSGVELMSTSADGPCQPATPDYVDPSTPGNYDRFFGVDHGGSALVFAAPTAGHALSLQRQIGTSTPSVPEQVAPRGLGFSSAVLAASGAMTLFVTKHVSQTEAQPYVRVIQPDGALSPLTRLGGVGLGVPPTVNGDAMYEFPGVDGQTLFGRFVSRDHRQDLVTGAISARGRVGHSYVAVAQHLSTYDPTIDASMASSGNRAAVVSASVANIARAGQHTKLATRLTVRPITATGRPGSPLLIENSPSYGGVDGVAMNSQGQLVVLYGNEHGFYSVGGIRVR